MQAGNCLDIVIEDVGLGIEHGFKVLPAALEIRNENLDGGLGIFCPDGSNRLGPDSSSAIRKFIPCDGCYDRMLKSP